MKSASQGSALLTVFLTLSIMTLWLSCLWRTTVHMNNLVTAKQVYEYQFRLAEALLEYGIGAARVLYKKWKNETSGSAHCTFTSWPPIQKKEHFLNSDGYSGKISVHKKDRIMKIYAHLLKNDSEVCSLRSVLEIVAGGPEQEAESEFLHSCIIREWAFDEQKTD